MKTRQLPVYLIVGRRLQLVVQTLMQGRQHDVAQVRSAVGASRRTPPAVEQAGVGQGVDQTPQPSAPVMAHPLKADQIADGPGFRQEKAQQRVAQFIVGGHGDTLLAAPPCPRDACCPSAPRTLPALRHKSDG